MNGNDNGYLKNRNKEKQKSKVKEIIENHYPDVACQKLTELLEEE